MSDEPKTRTWPEGQWTGPIKMKDRSQWQPIETAPKDGTHLLLIDVRKEPYSNGPVPVIGMWSSQGLGERWAKWVSIPGCYGQKPTHWMPLPLPPEQKT